MNLIRKYQLEAERIDSEPDVRLRILPFHAKINKDGSSSQTDLHADDDFEDFLIGNGNASLHCAERLPLLPE